MNPSPFLRSFAATSSSRSLYYPSLKGPLPMGPPTFILSTWNPPLIYNWWSALIKIQSLSAALFPNLVLSPSTPSGWHHNFGEPPPPLPYRPYSSSVLPEESKTHCLLYVNPRHIHFTFPDSSVFFCFLLPPSLLRKQSSQFTPASNSRRGINPPFFRLFSFASCAVWPP